MALISLRHLGAVAPHPLFQNLTLDLGPGDRVGLVAGNRAGKSTLLRCVAGQAEPDAGSVTVSKGATLAFLEQDVPPGLPALPLAEALSVRPLGALSGGWQRLALLARAWVGQPDALLLDEPTNHLDAEKIGPLERWTLGPAARTPMLVASHDRSFLDACTRRATPRASAW